MDHIYNVKKHQLLFLTTTPCQKEGAGVLNPPQRVGKCCYLEFEQPQHKMKNKPTRLFVELLVLQKILAKWHLGLGLFHAFLFPKEAKKPSWDPLDGVSNF